MRTGKRKNTSWILVAILALAVLVGYAINFLR